MALRLVGLYALLQAAMWVVVALPGEPTYAGDRFPLGWLLVAVFLVWLLARGSRVSWTVSLLMNVLFVPAVLLMGTAPIPPGVLAVCALTVASAVVLCLRPLREHVWRDGRAATA